MSQEAEPQSEPRPRTFRSLVLLALYVVMAGWAFCEQSTSWPHEGSWLAFAQFFLCPGIVFQSLVVLYARVTGRALKHRVLVRLGTVPLGLVIGAALGFWASALAMQGFERAYTPFAEQIGANLAAPCGGAAKYFAIPAVAAYNERTGRRPAAKLAFDGARFAVSFSGGSLDIDGSTIYYDSGARRWHKFHNDSAFASREFQSLTEGLAACKLDSAPAAR